MLRNSASLVTSSQEPSSSGLSVSGAVCRGRAVEGTKYNQEAGSSQKRQKARGHDAAPPITGADEIGDVPEQQAREIERVARPEHD